MSELDDALARLERVVARLEAALNRPKPAVEEAGVPAIAAEVAARVDAALATLGKLLEGEA